MKTSHQFAAELLNGPDLPIAVQSLFMEESANEPSVQQVVAEDPRGIPTDILIISAAITLRPNGVCS